MSLVPSLLQAIVHVDGEALVMHAGDKPYVVSPTGQVELATRGLALDAVNGILAQLLPLETQRALDDFGAVQHRLAPIPEFPGEQFTVLAARGDDDLWVEIRRRRIPDEDRIPDEFFAPTEPAPASPPYPVYAAGSRAASVTPEESRHDAPGPAARDPGGPAVSVRDRNPSESGPGHAPFPSDVDGTATAKAVDEAGGSASTPMPAVVVPLARNPIRPEQPAQRTFDGAASRLDRLLRLAAARGASTLYLSSGSRPAVRVEGDLQSLDGEPFLESREVESLLLTLVPERNHEALRNGAPTEWILDIEDIGRVRCMSFRDYRGPGGVFRLMPTRPVSVDDLGLPPQIQALARDPEGLLLVAGPRSSGKRTLISAFVDMINRTRRDHVITIEREINIVHESGIAFISQREIRGDEEDVLTAARTALREDPDVLVIEELRTAALMNVAFDASASGRLVVGGLSAHTAAEAVDRIIDLYGPDRRHHVQLALAHNLRGVVVQVLLRKTAGGRIAARELLLNTPAVSSAIVEGRTSQLSMAIEGGRRHGMMSLTDALVALVQQNIVDAHEAYRHAGDRQGLLAALSDRGVDTSFAERLA